MISRITTCTAVLMDVDDPNLFTLHCRGSKAIDTYTKRQHSVVLLPLKMCGQSLTAVATPEEFQLPPWTASTV